MIVLEGDGVDAWLKVKVIALDNFKAEVVLPCKESDIILADSCVSTINRKYLKWIDEMTEKFEEKKGSVFTFRT